MMEGMRILTVTNIGENAGEDTRVTPSPMEIEMILARDDVRQGMPAKAVSLFFKSGAVVELYVSEYDLITLEQAVGMYGFAEG